MSQELIARASRVIPGGVNSPVRAFKQVDLSPLFVARGSGCHLFDADGNQFIDYVGSWGPLILGHAPQAVSDALLRVIPNGTSFGAPTEAEVTFAELLTETIPPLEMVRLVSSGTEATMSAARLARGFTKRDRILKFNGCYHGHADLFLVKAGSGVATHGISGSAGVPSAATDTTLSVEFNDLALVEQSLQSVGPQTVAAIIVEPVAGNMGLVLPKPGFLQGLRDLCTQHGILLIFDEVMTGFRVGYTGASGRFGITPDLLTFGKVIGGGLPVGAFGGRRDIMEQLAPLGPVYQAGTLSGNPLAVAAGMAMLQTLATENPYPVLEERSAALAGGLQAAAAKHGIALQTASCGSMFGFFFAEQPVHSFADAQRSDIPAFKQFFKLMLERGVYLAPSAFEAGFIGVCHSEAIIEQTLAAAGEAFSAMSRSSR